MLGAATGCLGFARHEEQFTLHKISFHPAHAFSKCCTEQISFQSGPAVPTPRRPFSVQSVPRIATVRRGTAQSPFPKAFRNPHPRENRRLVLLRNERPRSPLKARGVARCLLL